MNHKRFDPNGQEAAQIKRAELERVANEFSRIEREHFGLGVRASSGVQADVLARRLNYGTEGEVAPTLAQPLLASLFFTPRTTISAWR